MDKAEEKAHKLALKNKARIDLARNNVRSVLKQLVHEEILDVLTFKEVKLSEDGRFFSVNFTRKGLGRDYVTFTVSYVKARKTIKDGFRKKLIESIVYHIGRYIQSHPHEYEYRRVLDSEAYYAVLEFDGVREWCDKALNGLIEIAHSDTPSKKKKAYNYATAKRHFFDGAKRAYDEGADYETLTQWAREIVTEKLLEE